MALFNSFTFGDVDSKDYGVYISGDSVYDSPARSVDLVQVPGRNGALALDNGYYENIEVTYPAGSFGTSQEEWREKMLGIRNALAAQRGYQRLIDTYHPEHYRLGMFFAGISASPVQYNRAGQFPIRFNCKPQRFLISGDTPVEFTEEGQEEVYGPASIASFEAKEGAEIRQLEVDLEPVQDLNGYDSPWPAGGGKNLLKPSTKGADGTTDIAHIKGSLSVSGNTYTFIPRGNNEDAYFGTLVFSSHASDSTFNQLILVEVKPNTAYTFSCSNTRFTNNFVQFLDADKNALLIGTTTNVYINTYRGTITSPANAKWFVLRVGLLSGVQGEALSTTIQIEEGSTATSFTPYSNICPISGHTEVNVARTGANVWDEEWEVGDMTYSDGANHSSANYFRSKNYIQVTPNAILYIKSPLLDLFFYDDGKAYLGRTAGLMRRVLNRIVTVPSGAMYMRFCTATVGDNTYQGNISINYPSTDTEYHAYEGDTYPISLGQTVYGGTLNVTTGVLTIDRAIVDLGTLTWDYNGVRFVSSIGGMTLRDTRLKGICSAYPVFNGAVADAPDKSLIFSNTTIAIYIKDSAYSDAATFKTALSGVQVCFELATPTTVQLTPSAVSALLGQNNIWADAGTVEVKVASPVDLTNPTNFPAKPLIRVYGNGSVQVGNTIATVQNNADGYVDIDCESMNCYDTTGGRNADVSFSGNDFPELASGDNGILLTGPSKVEITPRWWEL